MKKRHSIHVLLAAAALLLATAACTTDELADGNRLPEGQYPLEIARITLGVEGGEAQPWGAPQTRVGEIADGTGSVFSADDLFAVQIDGEEEVGTYAVQDDHTVRAETPLYWYDRNDHTVTAWYPATDGTIDLGNQSQSLAYLLSGTGTGKYPDPVTLNFTHALAKVRITPSDDALGEVQSLQLYTYTQCAYKKGNAGQGSQEGWIEMKKCEYTENGTTITCWEANVVPGYEIKKLRANGTEERDLSAAFTPEAGKFYNITLNKDKGYTDDGQGNYTVTSAEGLKNIAELVNEEWKLDINITLDNDIDLTGIDWTPICPDNSKKYTGTFDGGNHTITGLTVTGSNRYAGLFGQIGPGGTVKNVVLTEVNVTSGTFVGGVAGWSFGGNIENCSVSGSVSGSSGSDVGGVVGYQQVGSITGCSSSATVKGTERAGGVVGVTNGGTTLLTACYATGNVTVENDGTSNAWAGGIVGMNGTGTLIACYAAGNVSGNIVGGAVGVNYANVTACYWSGLPDNDNGGATKVDATTVTWQNAVDAMNTALQSAGSEWRYELTEALPTLKKQ
ncbi:GLUG motif-containing protein [Prevotella sp.]|uniref:GLUG motif-containing protein n=1 Tax=Prevotella sp. TaxID=59823 RepID=UPI003AB3C088